MQALSDASPGPLVGLREAARLLTDAGHPISHSTLSRQVGRLIPNRGTPRRPLVSVDEVILARRQNVDPRLQRARAAQSPLLAQQNVEAALPASAADPAASVNSHRADLERTKSRLAQLDLETRLGNLVDRRDVEDAFETLAQSLRDRLLAAADMLAPDLCGVTDVAVIRVRVEDCHRKVLSELADEYRRLAVAADTPSRDAA